MASTTTYYFNLKFKQFS